MHRIIANFWLALTLVAPALLLAQTPEAPPTWAGTGPCKQIVQACRSAGFVRGDAKEGYGLYRDCVNVIVRGTPRPANADKPLPAVPSQVVAACRSNPHFDQGRAVPVN